MSKKSNSKLFADIQKINSRQQLEELADETISKFDAEWETDSTQDTEFVSFSGLKITDYSTPQSQLKYNEEALLDEFRAYIISTYGQHYVGEDNIQYMDMVMSDVENGLGFLKHSAGKYINRLGKKDGFNRKDIMKSLHFLILLLYKADKDIFKETSNNNEIDRQD